MENIQFRAMGCQISAFLDCTQSSARQILNQVPLWFEDWEQTFSRFRPQSELSLVNHQSGIPTAVSDDFWDVLEKSISMEVESNGLVTTLVLPAIQSIGYDQSFEKLTSSVYSAADYSGYPVGRLNDLIVDEKNHLIQLPLGGGLDFGGISKGWAAEQAVQRLTPFGPALVNAGGDIAINDFQYNGTPWLIGVVDPFHPEQDLLNFSVGMGGVATSGKDFRQWKQNGVMRHHIIDPRNGLPAKTDLMSVTIIAPEVIYAEMAAKIVMLLGSQDGITWLETESDAEAILVRENGQIIMTQQIAAQHRRMND